MYVAIIMLAEKGQMHMLDSHAYILFRRLQLYFEVTAGRSSYWLQRVYSYMHKIS